MASDERMLAIAMAACIGLEPSTLRRWVAHLGSAANVWRASAEELMASCKVHTSTVSRFAGWRSQVAPEAIEARLRSQGIDCVVQGDDDYPRALLDLADPPIVLFLRGKIATLKKKKISVVGTRRASSYGLEAAAWVAETMAASGCCVVSGLALGVDQAAHRSALRQAQGATLAVLATGVDVCYPPSHRGLYETICTKGMVVSEYPPGTLVEKYRFPERNRIIAALSEAVVVVQAGEKSGALRTVDSALEIGRDVYVVPGPITSLHFRGSHRLLQQGAQILLDPKDCLFDLGVAPALRIEQSVAVPARWQNLYESLDTAQSASRLAEALGLPVGHVFAGLLELELAGLVSRSPGGLYCRSTRV